MTVETLAPGLQFREFFGLSAAFTAISGSLAEKLGYPGFVAVERERVRLSNDQFIESIRTEHAASRIPDTLFVLQNQRGAWLRMAALLKAAGARRIIVSQDRRDSERFSSIRTVIKVDQIRTIFLPNYKCCYSSFREFCFDNFDEFSGFDRTQSHALNRRLDLLDEAYADFTTFSVVRHPKGRFLSLYYDKFCRPPEHWNNLQYLVPVQILLSTPQVSPTDVLRVIEQIPDEYSDPHWKSQHFNMHFDGKCLVAHVAKQECLVWDLEELSRRVGCPLDLPHSNSTRGIRQTLREPVTLDDEAHDILRRRYHDDFVTFGYD